MLNNYTVKTRLFLLIGVMTILSIFLSVVGLVGMKLANDGLHTVYADRVIPLRDLKVIADMYAVNIVDTSHKVRNGNISWQEAIKNVDDAERIIQEKWKAYLSTVLVEQEEKLVAEITPLFQSTQFKVDKLKSILKQNDLAAITDFTINDLYPAIDPISGKFSELIDVQLKVAEEEYDAAQHRYNVSMISMFVSLIAGVGLTSFIGFTMIIQRLMNELGGEPSYAAKVVKEISSGNLAFNVTLKSGDKSSLLYSIDKMRVALSNIIVSVNFTMKDVAQGELSSRVEGEFQGDFNQIKTGMNSSLDTINETLNEVIHVAHALANGDLSQKMTGNYQGAFEKTKDSVNETVDALNNLIEEIDGIVYSGADCGDFSVKMTMTGKVGYGKRLAELINQLFTTTEKSLNDVLRVSQALAKGDLTQTIENDYVGAFAATKVGINTTVENLKSMISEIQDTGDVIASASKEISAGNVDLAHRTEKQAASLQQTAASMEELSVAVKLNTDNARYANQLASNAANTASSGVDVVNDVVTTMFSINTSSHQIVDIISVIDDIAFQTNILALNAAVEAARAGEQGRGFAIVATEVRNLSQRSANAANDIKRLINDSVERISSGSKQVEQAGKTISDIVNSIHEVTVLMSDITLASIEQNAGIEQINSAVLHMDTVTQQNAALVEEIAAAAESLSDQTRNLAIEMAYFRT